MATIRGNSGEVLVGANGVLKVLSFELTRTVTTADNTAIGDAWTTHINGGVKSWAGSISCYYDKDDTTGQVALALDAAVDLHLIPAGDGVGNIDFNGSATVTDSPISTENDSIVTINFSVTGNGALSEDVLT